MASVFNRTNEANMNVPRNTFDLSFQNNLTMTLGGLYPVFVQPVVPGDSFKIEPVFGLRFMPLTFPIQTKMTANLHFFYVRNRNLWKDWQEFITNSNGALTDPTKQAPIPPYFGQENKTDFSTGSLMDYLGVPTTNYDQFGRTIVIDSFEKAVYGMPSIGDPGPGGSSAVHPGAAIMDSFESWRKAIDNYVSIKQQSDSAFLDSMLSPSLEECSCVYFEYPFDIPLQKAATDQVMSLKFSFISSIFNKKVTYTQVLDSMLVYSRSKDGRLLVSHPLKEISTYKQDGNDVNVKISISAFSVDTYGFFLCMPINFKMYGHEDVKSVGAGYFFYVRPNKLELSSEFIGITDVSFSSSPWYNKKRLSTLACRAYESIYNSFYRDVRNNPLMVDGQPVYNKYILNDDGGADNTTYELRYRNWEPDFLTTAVQTPQQGIAPLVGISSSGTMKFADDSGNVYTAQAEFADDGETITSFKVNSPDMPQGNLRALVDLASSGISINDFRNVNALQRYLETNMRKGLRYVDWIKGHFDVEPSYSTLDMPEFLGGVSQPVNVQQVTQTVETNDTPLGDVAGQATCMGASRDITRYCDEHGFIIGILSVSPVPNYSQLLPKHFLFNNPLDYYTPEFGHIGYQPITYAEVCPLSTHLSGQNLDDVFGYQRAWYDMIARVDEVHGQFRTSLQDYLINRYFRSRPELGRDFLVIDPDSVNKPFVVQSADNQPILGQVYFKVSAKRPVPAVGIPRLE